MAIPLITKRRDRRAAELQAAVDDAVGKALSPAQQAAPAMIGTSGATYPVPNPSSPFNQTGGAFGANPLPRPNDNFGSLFGPGYPLFPDALDPLGPSGRAEPRRYQYRVTENIDLGQYGAPWTMLRRIASEVDVVARCIELVQDAIGGMEWSWGFSRQIINQIRLENDEPNSARATSIARDKYGEELAHVQKFWERPDERMGYTFTQWLSLAAWAHLVFDGIAVYPSYTLGGDLHSLSLLDTSTIKILLDNQGFIPRPPAPAYQQILYGFPRGEFQAENPDDEGNIPNGFRSDQLAYYVRRPRLHTVYGFSAVEECINIAQLYMERQEWMKSEWSHGVTPKGVIKTTGTEGWTPEQFAYFQQNTNDQWSGQTHRRQQVMVLRPGMEWEQLKDFAELYNTNFEEWCVMQIGAKFGVPQQQLGIPMRSYLHSGAQNQTSMDLADKYAIDSLVNFITDCINDLTRRFMNVGPEITITATAGNGDESDLQRAQADASDVNNAIRTTNEIRAERGLPLISDKEADVLRATAGNAVIFFPGQLAYQEATEQAVLNGQLAAAAPNTATPDQADPNKSPALANEQPEPKSQSNNAETANRAVGHIASGTDMVTPGTDRKSRAATRQPGAPQSSSESGSYVEKELATFLKFAKSRNDRGAWREFEFTYISDDVAKHLNHAGADGNLDFIRRVIAKDVQPPIAAGIAVRAKSSGRVLMLQRSLEPDDPAPGKLEFPGGKSEGDESPYETAVREWQEEVGTELPDGEVTDDWLSPDGIYKCFVYEVADEADVPINVGNDDRAIANPDDPDGDNAETVVWMDPQDLPGNSAVRSEVALTTPWDKFTTSPAAKSDAFIDYSGRVVLPAPLQRGDRVVIEHQGGRKEDVYDPDDVADAASKAVAVVPIEPTASLAETVDLVVERLRPDLERYALLHQIAMAKGGDKSPEVHVHIPKRPKPVIHVDATSHDTHIHEVAAPEVHVDATSTHNVAAPEVHVDASQVHHVAAPEVTVDATSSHVHHVAAPEVNIAAPDIHIPDVIVNVPKQPKPTVTVQMPEQIEPAKRIVRQDDGSIVVEPL